MSQAELRTLEEAEDGSPSHGALVFPELIWKHYCWQHAVHPERYAKGRNGHRPQNGDARQLYRSYRTALDKFEDDAGEIVDAYWCLTDASAVVLTRTAFLPYLPQWRSASSSASSGWRASCSMTIPSGLACRTAQPDSSAIEAASARYLPACP